MIVIAENIINVPNVLTILRFVFSPVFFYLLLKQRTDLGLIVFMFVAVTDFADGWIARSTKTKTKFGEALDPIADKFMILLAIIALVIGYTFPIWAVPLILVRDIVSLCGSIIVYYLHKDSWKANLFGKLTTFLQIIVILAFIIDNKYKIFILYITIGFSIITGLIYTKRGINILQKISK